MSTRAASIVAQTPAGTESAAETAEAMVAVMVAAATEAVGMEVALEAEKAVAMAEAATVVVMAGSQKPRQHNTARRTAQEHRGSCRFAGLSLAPQGAVLLASCVRTLPTPI